MALKTVPRRRLRWTEIEARLKRADVMLSSPMNGKNTWVLSSLQVANDLDDNGFFGNTG
jgi:hypothetical protein